MEQTDETQVYIRLPEDGMRFLCTAEDGGYRLIIESVPIVEETEGSSEQDDDETEAIPLNFPWSIRDPFLESEFRPRSPIREVPEHGRWNLQSKRNISPSNASRFSSVPCDQTIGSGNGLHKRPFGEEDLQ